MRVHFFSDLCRLFRIAGNDERGMAAIELALIAPILALGIIGTTDLGIGIYRKMQVQAAAQAGVDYAASHGFVADGVAAAIRAATSLSGIEAQPEPLQYCGCASATGIVGSSCTSTCDGGARAGTYVTVATRTSYKTIIPYPLFPSSFELTAQSTVRIR
jgi:Flp pilus assembly protein TadG